MYPKVAGNPDYTSVVSDRHCARLTELVAVAERLRRHDAARAGPR
jgi:hypothetical protein